jgi:hypothetical protein
MNQQSIRIDDSEIDDNLILYYRSVLNTSFPISKNFNFHDFTDSFAKTLNISKKEILNNRIWGQKSSNILNLRTLCKELLEPIVEITGNIPTIKIGILNKVLIKKLQLGSDCLMWFGKAATLRFNHKNNFEIFMKILESKLIFGELIYFAKKDMIYITLPTFVVKNIVKVKE